MIAVLLIGCWAALQAVVIGCALRYENQLTLEIYGLPERAQLPAARVLQLRS